MSDAADQAASVRRYDFTTAEKPPRALAPALEATVERLNDRFARLIRQMLLQHLRRAVTVTPARAAAAAMLRSGSAQPVADIQFGSASASAVALRAA